MKRSGGNPIVGFFVLILWCVFLYFGAWQQNEYVINVFFLLSSVACAIAVFAMVVFIFSNKYEIRQYKDVLNPSWTSRKQSIFDDALPMASAIAFAASGNWGVVAIVCLWRLSIFVSRTLVYHSFNEVG